MSEKKQSFEASLKELELIVKNLEDGDLSLEESLKLFEKGVRLSRECQERLNQAERRIEVLLEEEMGNTVLQTVETEVLSEKKAPSANRPNVFEEGDEIPF